LVGSSGGAAFASRFSARSSLPILPRWISARRTLTFFSSEPIRQIFEKQVLAKVLTPGEFEFGLGSHSLSRYCYAPREMILCRRNTEEWVRWHSPIQMLLITVPDQTFHSVAEEMGGRASELNGTPLLKDERIRALL